MTARAAARHDWPKSEHLGDSLLELIINTTINAVRRRARGMRDEEMLLLKLKWAAAPSIRAARDLIRHPRADQL